MDQGLDRVDIKDERFAPRNTVVRMRSRDRDAKKQVISWNPRVDDPVPPTVESCSWTRCLPPGQLDPRPRILEGCWKLLESSELPDRRVRPGAWARLPVQTHRLTLGATARSSAWFLCDTCRTLDGVLGKRGLPEQPVRRRLAAVRASGDVDSDTNHYRVIYQTMKSAPLSAQEHTAQWDAKEAAEIQRQFISTVR